MKRTSQGISLLEVLLSIVVGASIIMAGVHYYAVVNRGSQVSHAISQVRTLTKASYHWLNAQAQDNFACDNTRDNCSSISLQSLIDAGLITNTDMNTKDPWGGDITISPGTDPTYVNITMASVPNLACKQLAQKLRNVSHAGAPTCDQALNSFTGEF